MGGGREGAITSHLQIKQASHVVDIQELGERTWKPQRVGSIPGIPAHRALWPCGPQALGATWLLHG